MLETESFVIHILPLGFWRNTDLGYWLKLIRDWTEEGFRRGTRFIRHFPTWVLEILTLVYWVEFKPRLNWQEFFTEGVWQYSSSDLGFGDTGFRLLGRTSEESIFVDVFLLSKFTCVSVILLGLRKFGWDWQHRLLLIARISTLFILNIDQSFLCKLVLSRILLFIFLYQLGQQQI